MVFKFLQNRGGGSAIRKGKGGCSVSCCVTFVVDIQVGGEGLRWAQDVPVSRDVYGV